MNYITVILLISSISCSKNQFNGSSAQKPTNTADGSHGSIQKSEENIVVEATKTKKVSIQDIIAEEIIDISVLDQDKLENFIKVDGNNIIFDASIEDVGKSKDIVIAVKTKSGIKNITLNYSVVAEGDDLNSQNTDIAAAIEELADKCKTSATTLQPQTLKFPQENKTCWDNSNDVSKVVDAVSTQDGYFSAMVEQKQQLTLPAGSQICSLEITFGDQDAAQEIIYDDHIFLTYNGLLLAASSIGPIQTLIKQNQMYKQNDFIVWDWNKLKGQKHQDSSSYYCAGNDTTCFIPATETLGQITIKLSEKTVQSMTVVAKQINIDSSSDTKFSFITTGDDNPESDCRHSDFEFTVNASYVTN